MASHTFYHDQPSSSPLGAIGTPSRSVAAVSSTHGAVSESLSARYERVMQNDQDKTNLLRELIIRYDYVSQELARFSQDRDVLANWQAEKKAYIARENSLQAALARNPFVAILIDGDGMIFHNEFIRDGEMGGRRAAAQLQASIANYIEQETQTIPTESRVICRVYANVSGLADVLVKVGIIDSPVMMADFVRGFTRGKTLFDFVDVGPGKDRADEKVIESFKLYIEDYHCRQIFFGCSHDNGFARLLEEYMTDASYVSKVTLLEGVPFEKELVALPYATKKFPELFRDTKISVNGMLNGSPLAKTFNTFTGLPTRFPPARPFGSQGESPLMDSPVLAKFPTGHMPRTPSSSTLASDGAPAVTKPTMSSWASKAAAPAPLFSDNPIYMRANRDEVIARNRAGQRVDPQSRDYDKAEVDRIKKIKMCNVHFLRHECPYHDGCTHLHNYEPTDSEIATLRLVARMAPCQNGSGCQDVKCIYGHRCAAPPAKTKLPKGTKNCIFGEACKFPEELHDIDCQVVKTLVIK